MRLGKILFVVGVVIILCALMSGTRPISETVSVRYNVFSGFLFTSNSDIYVEVEIEEQIASGVFSMYLLDGIDANNTVVQNKSITLATPLAQFENITSFDGTFKLPGLGVYALCFTSSESEFLFLSITVQSSQVNLRLLSGGAVLVSLGLIGIVSSRVLEKKEDKSEVSQSTTNTDI